MRLYRVFNWIASSAGDEPGGPLFVPRDLQGAGRHDAPDRYGAWYCSCDPISAVAESIQFARGQRLTDSDFVNVSGAAKALLELRLGTAAKLLDLDDPAQLASRSIRPSRVATKVRATTQQIANAIFDEGVEGFLWWSTLEAQCINVTLFYERALPHVSVVTKAKPLSTRMQEVREAAERVGVLI